MLRMYMHVLVHLLPQDQPMFCYFCVFLLGFAFRGLSSGCLKIVLTCFCCYLSGGWLHMRSPRPPGEVLLATLTGRMARCPVRNRCAIAVRSSCFCFCRAAPRHVPSAPRLPPLPLQCAPSLAKVLASVTVVTLASLLAWSGS